MLHVTTCKDGLDWTPVSITAFARRRWPSLRSGRWMNGRKNYADCASLAQGSKCVHSLYFPITTTRAALRANEVNGSKRDVGSIDVCPLGASSWEPLICGDRQPFCTRIIRLPQKHSQRFIPETRSTQRLVANIRRENISFCLLLYLDPAQRLGSVKTQVVRIYHIRNAHPLPAHVVKL